VQGRAKAAYQQFVLDPNHPGLKFWPALEILIQSV
jgi:hypothetical protein